MERARHHKPQIERWRSRRNHPERVLHAHKKQQTHGEYAGYPMVPRHVHHILRRPSHTRRLPDPLVAVATAAAAAALLLRHLSSVVAVSTPEIAG